VAEDAVTSPARNSWIVKSRQDSRPATVVFGEGEAFQLVLHGPPPSKGRPRFTRHGRPYTDASTREAEESVVAAWMAAGRPVLADGPVRVSVVVVVPRPRSHYRSDGTLSAAGLRAGKWWPRRRPDVDNVAKAVMDALSGRAWHDDACVASLEVWRRWAVPGETAPCTQIWVTLLEKP
jgi:Holliday junction resolvase RusA-like endonuclease